MNVINSNGADSIATTYSNENITDLTGIAVQCPLSGGAAVFQARGLLASINHAITYNDNESCVFYNDQARQAGGKYIANGITKVNDKKAIGIHPNPAHDETTIELVTGEKIMSIKVVDVLGKEIDNKRITENKSGKIVIDTKLLADGVYEVKIVTASASYTAKLIKQ